MNSFVTQTALTVSIAVFAFAQTPDPSKQIAADTGSPTAYRGVLMDASCQVIQNRTTPQASADASRSRATPSAAGVTPAATTGASSPSSTDAAAPAAVKEAARAATSGAAENTGVNPQQSGQAVIDKTTKTQPSSVTTYSGPSVSVPKTNSPSTTHIGGADDDNVQRSRSAETAETVSTDVREKYKDCLVTPTTTSFALMSNGQLYMVDDTAGALRQRMSSSTGASAWHTVTITGKMNGDRISAIAVK